MNGGLDDPAVFDKARLAAAAGYAIVCGEAGEEPDQSTGVVLNAIVFGDQQ